MTAGDAPSGNPLKPVPRGTGEKAMRPRDAASILLIDRSRERPHVLVGKRGNRHAFMPDLYVFPGGRRDRTDHALPFSADLHPAVISRLVSDAPGRLRPASARALALAAIRELGEETGLLPEHTGSQAVPDLSRLRYVARAITPPGHVRRFDTRFFLTFADEINVNLASLQDSDELSDLRWLDMADISGLKMPDITRTVLEDVTNLMIGDPSVPFGTPVPFYFMRHGRFIRTCE